MAASPHAPCSQDLLPQARQAQMEDRGWLFGSTSKDALIKACDAYRCHCAEEAHRCSGPHACRIERFRPGRILGVLDEGTSTGQS